MDAFSLFWFNFHVFEVSLNLDFYVRTTTECSCLVIASRRLHTLMLLSLTWQNNCYIWLKFQWIQWKILTKHLEPLFNNMETQACLDRITDLRIDSCYWSEGNCRERTEKISNIKLYRKYKFLLISNCYYRLAVSETFLNWRMFKLLLKAFPVSCSDMSITKKNLDVVSGVHSPSSAITVSTPCIGRSTVYQGIWWIEGQTSVFTGNLGQMNFKCRHWS